jgi:competence protein ComEA
LPNAILSDLADSCRRCAEIVDHSVFFLGAGEFTAYNLLKGHALPLGGIAMDQAPDTSVSGAPPTPPIATQSPLLTWPIGVQIALGFLITANVFFLLGRWTQAGPPPFEATAINQPGAALDLNRANKAELRLIPGIGDALAQRIVDYRARNGSFRNIDELRKVAGIGPKTLDRLRHCLFVTPEESFAGHDEVEPMSVASKTKPSPRTATASKKASQLTEPINVNLASQTDLQKLPGIGPKLSQRILDTRAKAAFKSIDDLRRVPGIGPKTLEKLRPHVTIGEGQVVASSAQEVTQ